MNELMNWLIPDKFMPHGHCYLWEPLLVRQIVVSNLLIGFSYYCIPLALIYFIKKRKDIEFNWIFIMFSAFIFFCGTTHFIEVLTIWEPAYRLQAAVASMTALLSVATVIMLCSIMPRLLEIPSPALLRRTIGDLEREVKLRESAENGLMRLNAELDEKVKNRTQELTAMNLQLNATQRTLENKLKEITKINEELNRFAYVASHDLKSPLHGIDQIASWLAEDLKGKIDDATTEHLRLMRIRINRLERLLDDLLAYSRAGKTERTTEMLDTAAMIKDVFELFRDNGSFSLVLQGEFPRFVTARTPLESVLRNLFNNAIKHHDCRNGVITIAVEHVGDQFEFSIADDGPGIPPEHYKRIFGMFQTLRPRDAVEGSGMGLAIVKKTVESFGGTIDVGPNQPRGTVFRFTWPDSPHLQD